MAKVQEIKRRIKSTEKTRQITKTMEMVATARIRRAQERIEATRPYTFKMMEVLTNVSSHVTEAIHPLLEVREPPSTAVIVALTSNRGLCGAFNTNIIRKTEALKTQLETEGKKADLIVIGRKGANYFRYTGASLLAEYTNISEAPSFYDAKEIARLLIERYVNKETDEIHLIFNHFKSVAEQRPVEHRLLPIKSEVVEGEPQKEKATQEYLFEPSAEKVLFELLPTYVETLVYRALLESIASEYGARRTAMKSASDNAQEMISYLTRSFNRARQAQITQEISEIVGGADALKMTK